MSNLNKLFQWEGRQLTQIVSYGTSLTFKYNDQGIRTQKVQNSGSLITTNYILDGDKVLVETRSNGITIYYTYDVDGSLLSMNYNGTEYFYITNLQGDIIELVDINGYSVVTYTYDAWGNIIYKTSSALTDINPYRYRGYRFDVETGYYYLQSRYYNPQIGRFISADGILGETGNLLTQNMYAYAGNNPVMHVDPDGDTFTFIVFVIIGVMFTAGLVSVAPKDANSGENITVTSASTPYPSIYGFDIMGIGVTGTYGLIGNTCNLDKKCQNITIYGVTAGFFGVEFTEYSDKDNSLKLSVGPIFLSLESGKYMDINSYSAGVSIGFSGGNGSGSASGSIDIDFLGILRDLQDALKKGDK